MKSVLDRFLFTDISTFYSRDRWNDTTLFPIDDWLPLSFDFSGYICSMDRKSVRELLRYFYNCEVISSKC